MGRLLTPSVLDGSPVGFVQEERNDPLGKTGRGRVCSLPGPGPAQFSAGFPCTAQTGPLLLGSQKGHLPLRVSLPPPTPRPACSCTRTCLPSCRPLWEGWPFFLRSVSLPRSTGPLPEGHHSGGTLWHSLNRGGAALLGACSHTFLGAPPPPPPPPWCRSSPPPLCPPGISRSQVSPSPGTSLPMLPRPSASPRQPTF